MLVWWSLLPVHTNPRSPRPRTLRLGTSLADHNCVECRCVIRIQHPSPPPSRWGGGSGLCRLGHLYIRSWALCGLTGSPRRCQEGFEQMCVLSSCLKPPRDDEGQGAYRARSCGQVMGNRGTLWSRDSGGLLGKQVEDCRPLQG